MLFAGVVVAVIAAAGVIINGGAKHGGRPGVASSPPGPPPAPPRLIAGPGGRLHTGVEAASAVALDGERVLLLGGLNGASASRRDVSVVAGGREVRLGGLPAAVHDAAAVRLGGSVYLFGGGQSASSDAIVRVDPRTGASRRAGRLPEPRSDLGAATIGDTAYMVGGFTETRPLDSVLAWRPGQRPRQVARLPLGLRYAAVTAVAGRLIIAGGSTPRGASRAVYRFDPTRGRLTRLSTLPAPVTHAAAVRLAGYAYVVGGRGSETAAPGRDIVAIDTVSGRISRAGRLPNGLSDPAAASFADHAVLAGGRGGRGPQATVTLLRAETAGRPAVSHGRAGDLAPGSDPGVLPGNLLIADRANDRLVEIDPQGRVRWQFPRRGDLRRGETFRVPDDAFFTTDRRRIVATQEDDFAISVIDVRSHRIVYRYGAPGIPGSGPNRLYNPDDAIPLRRGLIISADIKNCRLLTLRPPSHRPLRQLGAVGACTHAPPRSFGSPNGAFPTTDGGLVVTEITGNWVDFLDRRGKLTGAIHPPGFTYPSDTNQISTNRFLSVDYSHPGAVEIFDRRGRVTWRFHPTGKQALDHPSLALPLPNGDVLVNDDFNHRVIVVDPRRHRIVWQYGHLGRAGRGPGYLNVPDGVDLAPPHAVANRVR